MSEGSVVRKGTPIPCLMFQLHPCAVATWMAGVRRWRLDVTVDLGFTGNPMGVELTPASSRQLADALALAAGAAELLGTKLREELAGAGFAE